MGTHCHSRFHFKSQRSSCASQRLTVNGNLDRHASRRCGWPGTGGRRGQPAFLLELWCITDYRVLDYSPELPQLLARGEVRPAKKATSIHPLPLHLHLHIPSSSSGALLGSHHPPRRLLQTLSGRRFQSIPSRNSLNRQSTANMSPQAAHPALLIPGPIEFDDAVLQSMSHYRYVTHTIHSFMFMLEADQAHRQRHLQYVEQAWREHH